VFSAFHQWNRHAKRVTALSRLKKDHENQMGENEVRFTAYIRHVLQCCQLHFERLFNLPLLFTFLRVCVHTDHWMDENKPLLVNIQLLQCHPEWKWGTQAYHGQSRNKGKVALCLITSSTRY
jgi:hypothetical protein